MVVRIWLRVKKICHSHDRHGPLAVVVRLVYAREMTRLGSCRVHCRAVLVLGLFIGCYLTAFASRALAGDHGAKPSTTYTPVAEGSSLTHRSQTDGSIGQVYIYVGAALPAGTNPIALQYLFDLTTKGNTAGYITPLLIEYQSVEAFTIYTVVGIGKSFEVQLNSTAHSIPFDIIEGVSVPTGSNFTFGFVNAAVESSGTVLTSPGAVDYDNPTDGGQGVGGTGTTNDWLATSLGPPYPAFALGTTFAAPGANADYSFVLPYRTYSARAVGALAAQ
jgi:hypothetical protein